MLFSKALFYPTIDIHDEEWLKVWWCQVGWYQGVRQWQCPPTNPGGDQGEDCLPRVHPEGARRLRKLCAVIRSSPHLTRDEYNRLEPQRPEAIFLSWRLPPVIPSKVEGSLHVGRGISPCASLSRDDEEGGLVEMTGEGGYLVFRSNCTTLRLRLEGTFTRKRK